MPFNSGDKQASEAEEHEAFVLKQRLKEEAARLGFVAVGVAPAEEVDAEARARHLAKRNRFGVGDMTYLERNDNVRFDPRLLVPGAQSIVMLAFNYYPSERLRSDVPQIARYAYGADYHKVLKDKLYLLLAQLKEWTAKPFSARVFVDSAPFMERYWAVRAGIGRIGRNGLVLIPGYGSFCFLSEMILTLSLPCDEPLSGSPCGKCHRCIEACPMGAVTETEGIIPPRCISYHTIESKSALPDALSQKGNHFVFGCDVCQLVCPHNRSLTPHHEPLLNLSKPLAGLDRDEWLSMTEERFNTLFHDSPLARAGLERIRTSIRCIGSNDRPLAQ